MTFSHIKLETTTSTQDHIIKLENPETPLLCSTLSQTMGRGRGDHVWEHLNNSLAFSFTVPPSEVLTLTSLEIAVLINIFLRDSYSLTTQLKWPNDIHNADDQKVGGIILHNGSKLVVGVGINWSSNHHQYGSLFTNNHLTTQQQHQIPADIYAFVLKNRLSSKKIMNLWNSQCSHLNKIVKISDNNFIVHGKFIGIGPLGEAIIEKDGKHFKYYTGSLESIG